jgi:hypothetical protein
MSLDFGFFDSEVVAGLYDREYNSDNFASCFAGILEDGIVGIEEARRTTSDGFKVTQSPSSDDYVVVNAGFAWINGRWALNDGPIYLQIDGATGHTTRIDRVVLRCNYRDREFVVAVKKGENIPSGADPDDYVPSLTNNTTMKEISLAKVGVITTGEEMFLTFEDDRTFAQLTIHDGRDMSAYYTANETDDLFDDVKDIWLGGLEFAKCTQDEYDAMPYHPANKVFFIVEEE